ncbi:hypothetical protein CEP54_010291 [Fusarium duplospermum]|uniref:Uncharacterized protein n=1 Tax=Fusarium duplospermum TaxID=1325734 RepID=A0A428PKX5_9HYPO|nr:hypothetical protein CEP54_010291 [Fusarium duplospermum]
MESSASQPIVPWTSGRYPTTLQAHFTGGPHVGLRVLAYRICFQEYHEDLPYDPTGDGEGRKMVVAQQGPVILNCNPVFNGDNYHSSIRMQASRSDALICVYSVTDRSSFDKIQALLCRDMPVPPPPEGPVIFVAASKTDLPDWKVSLDEGRELSSRIGAKFLVTSAKTGVGYGDDDITALVDHIYATKARAEEERNARAANQASDEIAKSVPEKSKVHLMVSRVIERLKRWRRNRRDPSQEDSTSTVAPPPAKLRPRDESPMLSKNQQGNHIPENQIS